MHREVADTEPNGTAPEALENEVEKKCLERACPPSNRECLCPIPILGIPNRRPVSVHKNARFIPLRSSTYAGVFSFDFTI